MLQADLFFTVDGAFIDGDGELLNGYYPPMVDRMYLFARKLTKNTDIYFMKRDSRTFAFRASIMKRNLGLERPLPPLQKDTNA